MIQGRGQRHPGLDAKPRDGCARLMAHLGIIPRGPAAVAPGLVLRPCRQGRNGDAAGPAGTWR
jgi:hypothetical protein